MESSIGRLVSTLYFLIVFENLFTETVCQSETKADFCLNPKPAENFDIEWLKTQSTFHKAWNIQLADPVIRSHIAKYLKETDVTNEDELAQLCAKDIIDEFDGQHFNGRFQGFGNQISHWNCSIDETGDCTFNSVNNVFEEHGKFYLTYFDGIEDHNLIGFVICFQSGDVGWYVSTVSESISAEETTTALNHFKSLGFDPKSHIKIQAPTCTK